MAPPHHCRILVVDGWRQPDPRVIQALSERHDIRTASTGAEALAALAQGYYKVALIRDNLPDVSAADLSSAIADSDLSTVRVLMGEVGRKRPRPAASAFDFVVSAATDLPRLLRTLAVAVELHNYRAVAIYS